MRLCGLARVRNRFHVPGNRSIEQMRRFKARRAISSRNQREWYILKRFSKLKNLKTPGLNPLANSMLSLCGICGISVPKMEAVARMIRSTMVNLTELKKPQMMFSFFFRLDFPIAAHPRLYAAVTSQIRAKVQLRFNA